MKLLGIDYGTKNIGLATGDTETQFAFPLCSISGSETTRAIDEIIRIAHVEKVALLVVGMPYATDDTRKEGEMQNRITDFIVLLSQKIDIPVESEDERYTSTLVERQYRESGDIQKKFDRDAAAAAAIVSTYMQRHADLS